MVDHTNIVEVKNDEGLDYTPQFSAMSGPKHCPVKNLKSTGYFNLHFTVIFLENF